MNKSELRKWLEQHSGPKWDEERTRIVEEHLLMAHEIMCDMMTEMVGLLKDKINDNVDYELSEMKEFPEVLDLLKKF